MYQNKIKYLFLLSGNKNCFEKSLIITVLDTLLWLRGECSEMYETSVSDVSKKINFVFD